MGKREVPDWFKRLESEREENQSRLNRLTFFVSGVLAGTITPNPPLSKHEQALLSRQVLAMQTLNEILTERVQIADQKLVAASVNAERGD